MAKKKSNVDNLKKYVDAFFRQLELYDDYKNGHDYKGLLKSSIDVFLNHESDYTAKNIYQAFFMIYQITPEKKKDEKKDEEEGTALVSEPNTLLDLVDTMERYEKSTGKLIERQRDHFIHSVNVFLLGLAIYAKNKNYRNVFKQHIENSTYERYYRNSKGNLSHEEFLYRWGIASLFHDIGYPFEIIGKQLNKFINDGVKSISNAYDVNVSIDFKDFNEFNSIVRLYPYEFADEYRENYPKSKILDLFKPTEIMAHKIAIDFNFNKEKFKLLRKHLNNFVIYMKENNFIDHGFYSAILVLNSYGSLIQKYSRHNDYFFYPIVESATAILLHNYYNKTLQKDPFNLGLLDCETNPIAYLLILCDELQEWNRQPFGVIDVQKSHVNDLIIKIDDERIDVEYILKNGFMGLGFSKDKQEFIKSVLDIGGEESIFRRGLSVVTTVDETFQEDVMRDIDIADIQAPGLLIRNIEKLAIQINEQYNETTRQEYQQAIDKGEEIKPNLKKKYKNMRPFKKLDADKKLSNIRQARSIPKKLNMIGCEIVHKSDKRDAITEFSDKEVTDLAIFEHKEWMEEKKGNGWVYGEEKDDANLISPYLVEWDKLSDEDKKFDEDAIRNIPDLLDSIGLKIVNSKIKILTFKMHEAYLKRVADDEGHENSKLVPWDELDDYIQYSNYKQANFNIKLLNERGYDLVPDVPEDKRKAIFEFSKHDLEHFAKREHRAWYKLKFNLGWRYGSGKKGTMTNKNLVPWEKLDKKVQENNIRTFETLPYLCADSEVGLKIVRSE